MERLRGPFPEDFYTLACTYARTSGAGGIGAARSADTALGDPAELKDRAMEALRRAVAAGDCNRDLLDRNRTSTRAVPAAISGRFDLVRYQSAPEKGR